MSTVLRHFMARTAFMVGVSVAVASCACVPFTPSEGAGGTIVTSQPGGSTTTTTSTTTSTTSQPGGSTSTTTTPGGYPTTTTTTTPGGGGSGDVVDVDALEPGDCATPTTDDLFVDEFELAGCGESHQSEVIASFEIDPDQYPEDAYPGSSDLVRDAYEACQTPFEDHVGIPLWESVYDITSITPSPSTWAEGDRTVTCLVVTTDGSPLVAPARNARR